MKRNNVEKILVLRRIDFHNNQETLTTKICKKLKYGTINGVAMAFLHLYQECDCHSFQAQLTKNRIPYDLKWRVDRSSPYSTDSFRIHADGHTVTIHAEDKVKGGIDIDQAIAAYQQNTIGNLLEKKKNDLEIFEWENQDIVMKAREISKIYLSNCTLEKINELESQYPVEEENSSNIDLTDNTSDLLTKKIERLINFGYKTKKSKNMLPPKFKLKALEPISKSYSFTIKDPDVGGDLQGKINATDFGITLKFEGYGDCLSNDEEGTPIYIGKHGDEVCVNLYADINQEDPTQVISLEGAKISHRINPFHVDEIQF